MGKLTTMAIKSLKPKSKPYTVADGGGLTLYITANGKMTWLYRFRLYGKPKKMT